MPKESEIFSLRAPRRSRCYLTTMDRGAILFLADWRRPKLRASGRAHRRHVVVTSRRATDRAWITAVPRSVFRGGDRMAGRVRPDRSHVAAVSNRPIRDRRAKGRLIPQDPGPREATQGTEVVTPLQQGRDKRWRQAPDAVIATTEFAGNGCRGKAADSCLCRRESPSTAYA